MKVKVSTENLGQSRGTKKVVSSKYNIVMHKQIFSSLIIFNLLVVSCTKSPERSHKELNNSIKNNDSTIQDLDRSKQDLDSILEDAVRNQDINLVRKLLNNSIDSNINEEKILRTAIIVESKEIIELLLEHGIKTRPGDLNFAIKANKNQIVKLLLEGGKTDINSKDSEGNFPLIVAINYRNAEVVKLLLDNGADPNSENGLALQKALLFDLREIIKLLLLNDADPNLKKDKHQISYLYLSVFNNDLKNLKLLLAKGANPNDDRDGKNSIALICAIQLNNPQMVKLLLNNGANPRSIVVNETTTYLASDLALNKPEIRKLLQEAERKK